MKNISVLKSKLIMPELSDSFLLTDRLKKLHERMDCCKAINICAPAGYGKTTLAVSYFNCHADMPFRVCWYRLDPEDSSFSVFINHLTESLFPSETAEFTKSREALSDNLDIQLHPHQVFAVICREMWEHHSRHDETRTFIVLDDFQNVSQVQDICDMIRYMLDNLPPNCTILILSRGSINVFTEKQKLEKRVLDISIDDLAFTKSEIMDIMLQIDQFFWHNKLADIIAESTEGWIAGIIILCQAIKGKTSDGPPVYNGKFIHEDALFRYMSLEVLKSVDGNTQDALVRLALLQDFTEAEASEILGINDVKSLIDQCMGFGMFIQRIPGDPVVYRFHSLFREFLLYILKDRYPDECIASLHLKAAQYYISNSIYVRAAEHISLCNEPSAALDIVISAGFNKLLIGERAQLKIWLDLLPDEMINLNPVILMYKAQLMPNSRQVKMISPLQNAIKRSLNDNNLEVYFSLASVLLYILICNNNMKGLLEMTPDISEKLKYASEEMKNTMRILAMVRYIGEEEYLMAKAESENTIYSLLPEDIQWLYLVLSSIIYTCLGKPDQAEECMRKALILHNFKSIEPAKGFVLLFLVTALCLKNQKQELTSYISEILTIGNKYDYDYLSAAGRRLAAYEKYLCLDVKASVDMLDHAIYHYNQISNKAMAAVCKMQQLLWTFQKNNLPQYLDEAKENNSIIIDLCPGLMILEISLSILGAIARESGEYDLAERCLLSSIKAAREKKEDQVLCGALFHTAKLYFASGDMDNGHDYLKQAMELACLRGYYMFWDIHMPTIIEMLLRGIRYGYCTDFAEELLSRFYNSRTVLYLSEKVKCMDESRISAFIDEFISAYKADKYEEFYFVKAYLLGKPEIFVNGVRIPDTEWKTKKVKNFLEYLLLLSGSTISKETLAEALWPNSDSKSAIASQRTALYHLRKILTKYNVVVAGDNAFIYETPEGLQIRKNDALELDMHEFLHLYNQLAVTPELQKEYADILERMVSIYKGDLMEGSDYGDMVIYERERLKSIFMEACQKLSSLYIMRGELQKAEHILRRAFAAEPYNESICLELLKIYMQQGRRSKAVKQYYSFKKHLEQDLDIKIDKKLAEVIRKKPEA